MPTPYSGTPNLVTSITIPADGDNASAASVNTSTTAIRDMQLYLAQSIGSIMGSTCPIRIASSIANTKDIIIEPIPFLAVTEAGAWRVISKNSQSTINEANLESGMTYANNTLYSIYAYSTAGVMNFQISAQPTDAYNLYKIGDTSRKYLGAFKTDGMGNVLAFNKYGSSYNYANAISLGGGASTTPTAILVKNYLPTEITTTSFGRTVKIKADIDATAGASSGTLNIQFGAAGLYIFSYQSNTYTSTVFEVPTEGFDGKITYFLSVGPPNVQFYLLGYYD